jgi:hypothetical protein
MLCCAIEVEAIFTPTTRPSGMHDNDARRKRWSHDLEARTPNGGSRVGHRRASVPYDVVLQP